MNSVMAGRDASVEFHLTDAEPMPSLAGPDAMMLPHAVVVEFGHDRLSHVQIRGSVIGKNGRATKRLTSMTLHPDDVPRYAPEWVRDLVTEAHNNLMASPWSTGQG